ncbi:MAG: response regulator [Cyanobacteria bacterium J06638_28]
MRILLVEDDDSVAKYLEKSLISEHYAVDVANDGQAGWQLVKSFNYDLIVLDVMLPKLDGIQLCQRLRDNSYHMPVLLVTALDSGSQKISGLDAGADDYITKPFELKELLARVRVLLRRTQTPLLSTLKWGALQLDPNSQEVNYGDQALNLTPKEFRLLELFLRKPSQVFSRGAILDSLWNCNEAPGEDTVTAHMRGLRRKLVNVGAPSDLIATVYGVGYRLKPIETAEAQPNPQSLPQTDQPAPVSTLTATQKQQTQTALATLWRSVKSQHLAKLEIIKQTIHALQGQELNEPLRQKATQAAHSLTGALGIFGLQSGSDLARSIEQILRGKAPIDLDSQTHLVKTVSMLEAELSQALGQIEPPASGAVAPLFILVDNDLPLLQQLMKGLQAQGLAVVTALTEAALQGLQTTLKQPSQVNLKTLASKHLPVDVVLLNFALAGSNRTTLQWLSQLIHQVPPMLVLVCSPDGSLANRVKAAHLGNHSFFHNPDVAEVLKVVLEMRSHLQPLSHKVLAVDDDCQILEALQTLLEPQGLQLTTLNQPRDFWSTLQTSSPDLLLLDIEMPTFSGFELCQAIRQAPVWSRLPIVFLTAHSDAETKAAALRVGANDLVEKSSADATLLQRLFEQLKQSQLHRAMVAIAATAI